MNLFEDLKLHLVRGLDGLVAAGDLPEDLPFKNITMEPPRDASHGDMATNAAMVLAKPAKNNPRKIAEMIRPIFEAHPNVASAEIAGPGFINVRLDASAYIGLVRSLLAIGPSYGDSTLGMGRTVNVEYVSANPTGPLHVGHTRGAVFGDSLANLLSKVGYSVTKEYYINDAGSQIDTLARSLHLRYREAHGEDIGTIPEGLYPGEYLIPAAQALKDKVGDKYLGLEEADWLADVRAFGVDAMMDLIRADLKMVGIEHDLFFSEKTLHDAGTIAASVDHLRDRGHIYQGVLEPPKGQKPEDWEAREQTLFRATDFGDDVDRPLQKSDGAYTYFAADIAYHLDKYKRGFKDMIDVWGADHGGYVKRVQAAIKALSDDGELDVKLAQMVRLFRSGEPVKMSKRSGNFITMADVVEEVGRDVVRFIMLTRKNDAPLDFDFDAVMDQSKDNPVFYVQYAHARIASAFRKAAEAFPEADFSDTALAQAGLSDHWSEDLKDVMRSVANWPRLVLAAAEAHEPHRIAFYLYDLASDFHALWNKGNEVFNLRLVHEDDLELTKARLAMARAVANVLKSGLHILGVEPVEKM